ncbi:hypothetical protein SAMN05443545_10238 [Aidingimonas halophila]|uniref:Uncharacterized protein n=1 Tax=Aidingimonas halophila TaxID=574349 RepID=A0A1H2U0E2_9GAMM|nr:hypothetical protein SAMN05443545_10238 [Aidingimonas halophila]
MHLAVAAYQGPRCFIVFDATGDTFGEVQLAVVADLGAVEVIESVDDLGQALFLGIV